jgi:hypothetical protein
MKDSIRGTVISKWQNAGRPIWDVHKTLKVCVEADRNFETTGRSPAPKFHKAINTGDDKYLITWTFGCHFPWLNPRM